MIPKVIHPSVNVLVENVRAFIPAYSRLKKRKSLYIKSPEFALGETFDIVRLGDLVCRCRRVEEASYQDNERDQSNNPPNRLPPERNNQAHCGRRCENPNLGPRVTSELFGFLKLICLLSIENNPNSFFAMENVDGSDNAGPSTEPVMTLNSTSAGRVSGKNWKEPKSATRSVFGGTFLSVRLFLLELYRRSHLSEGLRTKSWEERRRKDTQAAATKKLENELKEERQAEIAAYVSSEGRQEEGQG